MDKFKGHCSRFHVPEKEIIKQFLQHMADILFIESKQLEYIDILSVYDWLRWILLHIRKAHLDEM